MKSPLPLLNRYRYLRPLRGVASGLMWLAFDTSEAQLVVVSSVTPTRAQGLRKLLGIRHSNLGRLVDVIDAPPDAQLPDGGTNRKNLVVAVAAHVSGTTLHTRLREGPVGSKNAVQWVLRAANGVSALHDAGGLHGAISSRSIVVERKDKAPAPVLTFLRHAANAAYCCPERVKGGEPSQEDDVWALHVTLFVALTGASPFEGATREDLIRSILRAPIPDLSQHGLVDRQLQNIMNLGFAKKSSERLDSVTELKHELAAWLHAHPEVSSQPGTSTSSPTVVLDQALLHRDDEKTQLIDLAAEADQAMQQAADDFDEELNTSIMPDDKLADIMRRDQDAAPKHVDKVIIAPSSSSHQLSRADSADTSQQRRAFAQALKTVVDLTSDSMSGIAFPDATRAEAPGAKRAERQETTQPSRRPNSERTLTVVTVPHPHPWRGLLLGGIALMLAGFLLSLTMTIWLAHRQTRTPPPGPQSRTFPVQESPGAEDLTRT